MVIYIEGLIWYLFLLDVIIYNFMSWKGSCNGSCKSVTKSHWLSVHWPLNRFFGLFYFILVLWLGYALYRMQLLGF
ncbi:hypothetical protein J4437_04235 [Candidatus Woesearchaeota archaeon]|nr:hypothetical protein [Candidatus Woesearchaeota archaeon]